MHSFMPTHPTTHLVAFVDRCFAAIARRRRARREDDALALIDKRMLRDIGIDRCEIRHVAIRDWAIMTADRPSAVERSNEPLKPHAEVAQPQR